MSPQNISQISEESHRSIKGLSGFEDWTENPRVGGSIPPLATIKSRTWAHRSNICCEISSHRGINISQAEQVGAPKPLLAMHNCRGQRPKQRTNPTFVGLFHSFAVASFIARPATESIPLRARARRVAISCSWRLRVFACRPGLVGAAGNHLRRAFESRAVTHPDDSYGRVRPMPAVRSCLWSHS